jgi:hypothetical protein
MINNDQYSEPIATDDKWDGIVGSGHVCYDCAYNCQNRRCLNCQEVDAQCDTCQSGKECLRNNPQPSTKGGAR